MSQIEHFRRGPTDTWQVAPGRVIITPFVGDEFTLRGDAAIVWVVLDRPRTFAELTQEAREIDPALSTADIRAAVDSLVAQGVVARAASDIAI